MAGAYTDLERSARAFVEGKYEFDALLPAGGSVPEGFPCIPSVDPRTFVGAALPFSNPAYGFGDETLEEVDPFLVVGGTYNDYSKDEEGEPAKIEKLNRAAEDFHLGRPAFNAAQYCKVGDLPLYVACEGKNRVLMFRRAGRPIKALVTRCPYPKPDELLLHLIKPANVYALRCLNPRYDDWFELWNNKKQSNSLIPFPGLAVPLLKAYGVSQGRNLYRFMTRRPLAAKIRRLQSSLLAD